MNQININGKVFTIQGNNVSIRNGKVMVDGKPLESQDEEKNITILIQGNIDVLDVDSCNSINVVGSVGSIETTNGDVEISGDVFTDVKTTNGDVTCGNVRGNIKTTNGSIKYRK